MSYTPPPPNKTQFWSAIITQTQGSVSVAAGSTSIVDIQPSSGETWLVWIDFGAIYAGGRCAYYDFDGSTSRQHLYDHGEGGDYGHLSVLKILTDSLYARLSFTNVDAAEHTAVYGYSGFKLSEPKWQPLRLGDDPVWKRKLTVSLPDQIKQLEKYACEIWDGMRYKPAIMLEENKSLAVDPKTKNPVERLTSYVYVDDFVKNLDIIKTDPDRTGYRRYFEKWREEGIEV